jgi:hypothetical protein
MRHCFPQCTRPIHSARTPEPQPDAFSRVRRTSSVRRQSAARSSPSPEEPPLAASLPARLFGAVSREGTLRRSHVSWWGKEPLSPFVPADCLAVDRDITPNPQTGRDCLAAHNSLTRTVSEPSPGTPRALPRSFYSGHSPPLRRLAAVGRYFYLADQARRRVCQNPEAVVVPALASVLDLKVTLLGRVTARSAWVGTAFRPALLSWRQGRQISPYENRSSGYRSHAALRDSAPSPSSLTGKPSLTFVVGPFVVELFMAGCLAQSPEWSLRSCLSPSKNSPRQPRCTNSLAQARTPRTGFAPALHVIAPRATTRTRADGSCHRRGPRHFQRKRLGLVRIALLPGLPTGEFATSAQATMERNGDTTCQKRPKA